jgi:hypothetical protein
MTEPAFSARGHGGIIATGIRAIEVMFPLMAGGTLVLASPRSILGIAVPAPWSLG